MLSWLWLWKILQDIVIPNNLTYLLRNLCAGQKATVRTGHGTTDWSKIGKGVSQGCILSPCLFNLCAKFSSVQLLSPVRLFATPWTAARQAPCQSPTPRVHRNPCPWSQWCHSTISSSLIPFSSCPQSFPASGSFSVSQLFASGGQSIGVSASTPVLLLNTQDWYPLEWTGWISLQSQESFPTSQLKSINSALTFLYRPPLTSICGYWKNHSLH